MSLKKPRRKCLYCGKECSRHKQIYCSNKCQRKFQHEQYIERWLNGKENGTYGNLVSKHIRKWLFDKYNNKCQNCGWSEVNISTGRIPLEVDHIDGCFQNSRVDNLRLLCPNCHSLTSTYKGSNKSNRIRQQLR